jgi:hypothetical protein
MIPLIDYKFTKWTSMECFMCQKWCTLASIYLNPSLIKKKLKKNKYKMTPFPIPQLFPINVISFSFFVSSNEKFVND